MTAHPKPANHNNRFAGSKFLAKTILKRMALHLTEHSAPGFSTFDPQSTDTLFAELMETLRLHMNHVLRLPWPVQKRRRLLCNYWEVEMRVKEIRLLLDPVVLDRLVADQVEADQREIDRCNQETLSP